MAALTQTAQVHVELRGYVVEENVLMDEQALEAQSVAALVRGGKYSGRSRSSAGKWASMIRQHQRPRLLVRRGRRRRILLGG